MEKENLKEQFTHIPGWGVDADWENDPVYPMRDIAADDKSADWKRPAQQTTSKEVQRSNERPEHPAVFGDTLPPTGLSGHLRRYAFHYSESKYRHWLPLLLADRINEVEGVIADVKSGFFPNIWKERGYQAYWKYDRRKLINKVATVAAVSIGVWMLIRRK
ncbi:hypothetical protein [Sphingobacterium paludis]|uniref:Uncharacterized protein n=1 Tax=Sphingobacterium paludis TaxID=1476465 RepID=A0A4V3E1K7_9SPHI|nr:hypothetical protein [Sphingobacterium paludis]TDS13158.1 hypothetical protein B0I21_105292 [Sphingobacterium paludis]